MNEGNTVSKILTLNAFKYMQHNKVLISYIVSLNERDVKFPLSMIARCLFQVVSDSFINFAF